MTAPAESEPAVPAVPFAQATNRRPEVLPARLSGSSNHREACDKFGYLIVCQVCHLLAVARHSFVISSRTPPPVRSFPWSSFLHFNSVHGTLNFTFGSLSLFNTVTPLSLHSSHRVAVCYFDQARRTIFEATGRRAAPVRSKKRPRPLSIVHCSEGPC